MESETDNVSSDDAELVASALAGGPEAFGPIVERYQDAVFGVALARVSNFHDAQDVAQAVLVEAFGRLANLREPAKLGAWLRKMAIHRSLDLLRRRKDMIDLDDVPEPPARPSASGDLREEVLRAIAKLGKPQREAVTLFYINGYSAAEVASVCGVPVSTVKARLHEARARLKEEMVRVVEDVLKSEAPKDDFAAGVYDAITQSLSWSARVQAIASIGPRGVQGWLRAMASPQWRHRRTAVVHQERLRSPENIETMLDVLKQALHDPNKKVRRSAAEAVLRLDVDEQRKRRELLPLVVPLLSDPSGRVRRMTAFNLLPYADTVPMDLALDALLREPNPKKRWELTELMKRIVARAGK